MLLKKIVSLILSACILFSLGVLANAETTESLERNTLINEIQFLPIDEIVVAPMLAYTSSTITALSISGSGVATGTAKITGYSGVTTKVSITMYLEKKMLLGLYWSEVASWTQTFNNYTGTLTKSYTVSSGTYRIRAVYTAYKGSASETITSQSSPVKY